MLMGVAGTGGGCSVATAFGFDGVADRELDWVLTRGVEGVAVDAARVVDCVRIRWPPGLGVAFDGVAGLFDDAADVGLELLRDCGTLDILVRQVFGLKISLFSQQNCRKLQLEPMNRTRKRGLSPTDSQNIDFELRLRQFRA